LGFWTSGSDAESSLSWKEILFSLKERGLTEPLLVVGDGLQDLREAVKEVYPEAQFQSDLVHKTRNVLRKVRKRDERAVLEDVKKMYAASSLEEFQEHFETFKKNWKHLYPEAVSSWERDLPYLTTHLGYPTLLQQHIRTRTL
jgi:transposase-like protein